MLDIKNMEFKSSLMQSQVGLPNVTIEQVIQQIFSLRTITRRYQNQLMSILLSKNSISPEEKILIDKIFDAVQRGMLKVVD